MLVNRKGFTLLEVMIFTTILSIVLVSTAAFVTRLVYNLRINEHRIYANYYVTEVQEWLASEREADWTTLASKADTGSGYTYCLNNQIADNYSITSLPSPAACSSFNGLSPAIYKRELTLRKNAAANPTTVTATIKVSWKEIWKEGEKEFIEEIQSVFTSY